MSDILIWNTIGAKKFCSFKKKVGDNNFCRNNYNISGLCSRQACPLANSKYATVLEIKGKIYLFMKTAERAHTPATMWERVPLHPNFLRALAQINAQLQFWPRFIRKRAKLRLTRLHQMLIRMRRMHGKQRVEVVGVHKKTEKQDKKREEKAHRAAQLQDTIKHELLNRLREGTYGDLYNDIINYNNKQFNKALDEDEEDFEFDWLEEEGEKESKSKQKQGVGSQKTTTFVEAYSDSEDDSEEEGELNFEYEYENEGQKRREKIRQGESMMDNDDDDSDLDASEFDGEDLDYDFDEDDDDDGDDDDSEDMEDQVPDFDLIKSKQKAYKQALLPPPQQQQQQQQKVTPAAASKPTPKAAARVTTTTTKAMAAKRVGGKGRGVDDL